MSSPRDRNEEERHQFDEGVDPREAEELNNSTATSSGSFLEKPWWRWGAIAIAALVIASFAVPALMPLFGGGNGQPEPQGTPALDFTLESPTHGAVTLSQEVARNDYVVVVFYRTYY